MARSRWTVLLGLTLVLVLNTSAPAQSPGEVTYVYDDLGRLIAVIDPAGDAAVYTYDEVGNLLSISRQDASTVSIIGFSPESGPVGAAVTIYGTGFSSTPGENSVTFNGTNAVVQSASATEITTAVPAGATTGPIAVTTAAGSATSTNSFTVTGVPALPSISSLVPNAGVAGEEVTINGLNFDSAAANNKVRFQDAQNAWAAVLAATPTTLQTTLPPGVLSGPVSVTTPAGTSTGNPDFFVPPPPYTGADVVATDRIAPGESRTVSIGTPEKIGLLIFDGTAGQRVSIAATNLTIQVCTLTLVSSDGKTTLSSTVLGPTKSNFIDTTVLPATGTYVILIDPDGSRTGSVTLTLYDVPPDVTGPIVPGGASVTVSIGTPGQNARLTFEGAAGQRVSLAPSNVTISVSTVAILNPDGSTLYSRAVVNAGDFIDTQVLPTTGTYTVLVDPVNANVGSMTLTLYDVPPDVTGPIVPGGPSVTVSIGTPGQNARLTFEGAAGQRVSLAPSNVTISVSTVAILNPDGSTLVGSTCAGTSAFVDTKTLPATGTYTITLDPQGAATGSLSIVVSSVPPDVTGTLTVDGPAVTVTITAPGQNARLTFSGSGGQAVTVRITGNTVGSTTVKLLKPDGSTLTSKISSASSFNLTTQTLPTTGTYTVSIDPSGANTGSLSVSVTSS